MVLIWKYEEIVLACDLVERNAWKGLRAHQAPVIDLSNLLRSAPFHPLGNRDDNFRSPSSVQRKTFDIATQHDDYRGKRTRGNRLDREVLLAFVQDPTRMTQLAAEIRATLASGDVPFIPDDEIEGNEIAADEGGLLVARHLMRERDRRLRQIKIDEVKAKGEALACEVCSFDFSLVYGDLGSDFIEVHHILPLHASGPTRTRLKDLALVCSNCHRMIHRASPWLTPSQLIDILRRKEARN